MATDAASTLWSVTHVVRSVVTPGRAAASASSPSVSCLVNSSAKPARTTAAGSMPTYGEARTWRASMADAMAVRSSASAGNPVRASPSISSGRGTTVAAVAVPASTDVTVWSRVRSGPSMTVVPSARNVGFPPTDSTRATSRGTAAGWPASAVRTTAVVSWASAALSARSSIVTGYMPASGIRALPPSTRCWAEVTVGRAIV